MGANVIESLHTIRDLRAQQGRRYQLWLIVLLIIMGTMSGCGATKLEKNWGYVTIKF